jgi:uncharacterized protein
MPRSVALGVAVGVFVAILPIPGLQLLAAASLAWLIRGHRGAAALATFAANPVTYPLFWLASYVTGATLLGVPLSNAGQDLDLISDLMTQTWSPADAKHARAGWSGAWPILGTLLVGALPLAALAAAAAYASVRHLLARHARTPQQSQRTRQITVPRPHRQRIRVPSRRTARANPAIKAAA